MFDMNGEVISGTSNKSVNEEQIEKKQNEVSQTIIDVSGGTMNREQVADKFPITVGELPQGFKRVPERKFIYNTTN